MSDSCTNFRTNLHAAALQYHEWGWSILPVRGDLDTQSPKAAAVRWSQFQQRRPTHDELESWFGDGRFMGVGVVCGRVSRLAVLDFDDAACLAAFANACPDLTETYTVESGVRGLPHYYYHVPDDVYVRGRRANGADFQFERTYVIAPPTTINGTSWQVANDAEPRTLTPSDVERINRFLGAWDYTRDERSQADKLDLPFIDLDANPFVEQVNKKRRTQVWEYASRFDALSETERDNALQVIADDERWLEELRRAIERRTSRR